MLSCIQGKFLPTINNAFNLFFEMKRGCWVGNIFHVNMPGIGTVSGIRITLHFYKHNQSPQVSSESASRKRNSLSF